MQQMPDHAQNTNPSLNSQRFSRAEEDRLRRIRERNEKILQCLCKENARGKTGGLEPVDFLKRIENVGKILDLCKRAV